ncbi:MAG: peptidylprolyl isomerase [Sphingomonadaceae bacterium]|nr:peptidylprolyl isomerase [Sphingomonadaceae bacterium]
MRFLGFLVLVTMSGAAIAANPVAPAPAPVFAATPADRLHLDLSTGGAVVIEMRPDKAPNHVARIRTLTRAGFYDGLTFHRVIDGFMAQTGDPKGTGEGGSPLPNIKAEFNDLPHVRGAVAMARATDNDSANSQFYIVFLPVLRLDGKYTVFGRVTQGMNFVDALEKGEPPANPSKIVHAWIEADGPTAPRVPLVVPAPVAAAPVPVPATPAPVISPPAETPPPPK